MSESVQPDDRRSDRKEEFRDLVRETFESHTKSEQYKDHPDFEAVEVDQSTPPPSRRHDDGASILRRFGLEPFPSYLCRASRQKHAIAQHPQALAHLVTHVKKWEKWELGDDEPSFGDIPKHRRETFDWYLGLDKDDPDDRQEARETRQKRLRPGGTGIILHGEQGTTKTTAMYWLIANIMHVNPSENVIWQSTLDDTEWQVFSPWATVCFPKGVDVRMTVNPHNREYRDLNEIEIDPADVVRQVIRYENPTHLAEKLSERRPGQVYVVYPDPKFRKCQSITTWPYETIWEVDESHQATDLGHFWFALMRAITDSSAYNEWTTLVADEAHKWLSGDANDENHKQWKKISDWSTYWGDARKKRLSCMLSVHQWRELNQMIQGKVRWGATMNGEKFPSKAPLEGYNTAQDLGDTCIWNTVSWNHAGYPDLKRNFSVPADISVQYPGFRAEVDKKS